MVFISLLGKFYLDLHDSNYSENQRKLELQKIVPKNWVMYPKWEIVLELHVESHSIEDYLLLA